MSKNFMDDYVPVNERLEEFYAKYPEGSLQSEIVELTASRVTVKAFAYRTPLDRRPGEGHSSVDIPGASGFTRGSEIENAETSAWGRAIASLGFKVKRGIASSEEVRNKQPSAPVRATVRPEAGVVSPPPAPVEKPAPDPLAVIRDRVIDILHERHLDADALQPYADKVGIVKGERATLEQWQAILALIERPDSDPAAEPVTEVALTASAMPPAPSQLDGDQVAAFTGGELLPENPAAPAIAKAKARAAAQKVVA